MKRIALFPLAALVLGACQDSTEPTGSLGQVGPQAEIEDALHNSGNQFFFFLPPMVPDPNATGDFDGSLAPQVKICEWTGSCATILATFTTTTGPGSETVRVNTVDEYYIVNWHTNEFNLDDLATYRIIVSVDAQELGHADVDAVNSGKELKNVDTGEFIALKDGRTLPIKFRIEEGALCVAPPSGLVSWWPGDTDASDIQGTNDGVLMNGASAGAPGKVAGAFSFDGVDDFVSFGNTAGNFGTSDFTIDFWIKPTSTRFEGVLGKRPICMHASFWDIRWDIHQGVVVELDQDGSGTNYNVMFATKAINDGNFHHVAIVRQGPAASVYIDGAVDATGTTAGTTHIFNSANLIAGKSACTGPYNPPASDGTFFFTGLLDEIEIFDRALSQTEIQAIYNAGSAGKCKP